MKTKKNKKIIISIISIILLCIIGVTIYGYTQLNKLKKVTIDKSDNSLGIDSNYKDQIKKEYNKDTDNIDNILLLGVDKEENASDSIIVLSIDENNKKLKMTSIMRDSYIDFPGEKVKKINYAYHYGGPQFTIKTINENYSLDIKDYIKVNFEGLQGIIDALGGVQIQVKDYEIPEMKNYGITKPGTYNLDGKQALGYSRIRHVGHSDYERTERQRYVLESLFEKVKSKGISSYLSVMPKILSEVETSMANKDILGLANKVITMGTSNIEQFRLPLDNYKKDDNIDGIYYLRWDKQPNVDALHKFIYGESSK